MRVDCPGFGVVVDPASFGDVEDGVTVRVETHPPGDELVFSAVDEGSDREGGGDVADEVEGEGVAFAAHEEVLDQVWERAREEGRVSKGEREGRTQASRGGKKTDSPSRL